MQLLIAFTTYYFLTDLECYLLNTFKYLSGVHLTHIADSSTVYDGVAY